MPREILPLIAVKRWKVFCQIVAAPRGSSGGERSLSFRGAVSRIAPVLEGEFARVRMGEIFSVLSLCIPSSGRSYQFRSPSTRLPPKLSLQSAAFAYMMHDHFLDRSRWARKTVVSIGDSNEEKMALRIASGQHCSLAAKSVKFISSPDPEALSCQLDFVT